MSTHKRMREAYRPHRGFSLLKLFAQDARYTMRQWRPAPGIALSTFLALGTRERNVAEIFDITYVFF